VNANRNRPGRGQPPATDHAIRPGAVVWLVPTTAGAPTAAYKQPQVTVVAVNGLHGMGREVTVRLPDGTELTTSPANIRTTQPRPPAKPRPKPARRPALELGPNEQEVPLW
jgi:hypothetical protein